MQDDGIGHLANAHEMTGPDVPSPRSLIRLPLAHTNEMTGAALMPSHLAHAHEMTVQGSFASARRFVSHLAHAHEMTKHTDDIVDLCLLHYAHAHKMTVCSLCPDRYVRELHHAHAHKMTG